MDTCPDCGHEHTTKLDAWDKIGQFFGRTPRLVCNWKYEMWADGCDCVSLARV